MIEVFANRATGVGAAVAAHKKLIVSRVTMANGRNHSGGKCSLLERLAGGSAPHAATAPACSVFCNRSRFFGRTPREQFQDCVGHALGKAAIIFGTAHRVPFAAQRALLTIREAFLFRLLERGSRYQNALALVSTT